MPVEGLPNPYLHRICRGCARWHHLHEGSEVPRLHWNLLRRALIDEPERKPLFWCAPCLARKESSRSKRRRSAVAAVVVGLAAVAAWFLFRDLMPM